MKHKLLFSLLAFPIAMRPSLCIFICVCNRELVIREEVVVFDFRGNFSSTTL